MRKRCMIISTECKFAAALLLIVSAATIVRPVRGWNRLLLSAEEGLLGALRSAAVLGGSALQPLFAVLCIGFGVYLVL